LIATCSVKCFHAVSTAVRVVMGNLPADQPQQVTIQFFCFGFKEGGLAYGEVTAQRFVNSAALPSRVYFS